MIVDMNIVHVGGLDPFLAGTAEVKDLCTEFTCRYREVLKNKKMLAAA